MYPEYSDPDVPIIFPKIPYPDTSKALSHLIPIEKKTPYPTNVGYNGLQQILMLNHHGIRGYPQLHPTAPQLRLASLASETPESSHSAHGPAEEDRAVSRCWNLAPWDPLDPLDPLDPSYESMWDGE